MLGDSKASKTKLTFGGCAKEDVAGEEVAYCAMRGTRILPVPQQSPDLQVSKLVTPNPPKLLRPQGMSLNRVPPCLDSRKAEV